MNFGKIDHYMLIGGGTLLVECSARLKRANVTISVVTSERHANEQLWGTEGTLVQSFAKNGIDVHIAKDIACDRIVLDAISETTVALCFGAAWIFRKEFLTQFGGRLLNFHGTRLPQNRGAANYSWQILRENRLGFCLIHQVDEGIDTGPIVKYREFFYPPSCRIPRDYFEIYTQQNLELFNEFVSEIEQEKEFSLIPQTEYLSSYWPRLSTEHHGYIDWNWRLKRIEQFICAFDEPYRGASTFVDNRRVYLRNCFTDYNDGGFHPFQTGLIYRKTEAALYVATEDGTLIVCDVRDEEGHQLIHDLHLGDRLYTPTECLERAKVFRAVYTPQGLKSSRP